MTIENRLNLNRIAISYYEKKYENLSQPQKAMCQNVLNAYGDIEKIETKVIPNMKSSKSDDKYIEGALAFRALNHNLRRKIIFFLQNKKNSTVTDVYIALRIEQSVASQHLSILRRSGIVFTERQGKYIYYSVNQERIKLIDLCAKMMNDFEPV